MKVIGAILFVLIASQCASAQSGERERSVRQTVDAFYTAFNSHNWDTATEFAAEDWHHINPVGGWTQGRDAVLKDLRHVHSTFLKGVVDTVESVSVRFASDDVALVVVTSRVGKYVTPDGVTHENERHRRSFVVARRSGRWLIVHDQNTVVSAGVP